MLSHGMVKEWMNDERVMMRKKVVMTYFNVLSQHVWRNWWKP